MPNFLPHRPSRGHSAGFLTFEAVVTYPFHPLVGRTVLVVGDHEHDGIRYFLIRQPHGGCGRKRVVREQLRRNWKDWEVLIHDHHEGYITWVDFERNQHLIADNANGRSYLGRGSIRRGEALLPGLFRCARCGRRLHVQYTGKGGNTQRYVCRGSFTAKAVDSCIGFGGMRVDRVVAQEVLDRLQPLGIEAALAAMRAHDERQCDKRQQIENAISQAQYEAARSRRQYDAVDPDNRLVAAELERRWNEKLVQLRDLEMQLDQLNQANRR